MRLPVLSRLPVPPPPVKLLGRLPRLLLKPVGQTPFAIQRLILETALKNVFNDAIADGDFDFLEGKYLKVDILDAGLCWFFSFNGRHLTVNPHAQANATISGQLHEFLLLANRQEDPDTLFFQRRLQIDGDTELGLEVKNILDTVELDRLPRPFKTAMGQFLKISSIAR